MGNERHIDETGADRSERVAKCTRLANLLMFLKSCPSGASVDAIRAGVEGYSRTQADDAFERQFRRDRRDLERMGFFIKQKEAWGQDGSCYQLEQANVRNDKRLERKDVALLRLSAQNALEDPSFPFRDELSSALAKLRLPGGRDEDDRRTVREPDRDVDDANVGRLAQQFAGLIKSGKAATFSYRSANADTPQARTVVPLRLFPYLGSMYLHAYDIDRSACRRFRLDRIVGELESPSDAALSTDVAAEARLHADDQLVVHPFQLGPQRHAAVVAIASKLDSDIARLTGGSGTLSRREDGWLWEVPAADCAALARWAVENGPGLEVLEPAESRRIFLEGLQAVAHAQARSGEVS